MHKKSSQSRILSPQSRQNSHGRWDILHKQALVCHPVLCPNLLQKLPLQLAIPKKSRPSQTNMIQEQKRSSLQDLQLRKRRNTPQKTRQFMKGKHSLKTKISTYWYLLSLAWIAQMTVCKPVKALKHPKTEHSQTQAYHNLERKIWHVLLATKRSKTWVDSNLMKGALKSVHKSSMDILLYINSNSFFI